jgi:dolichol-phosphate mannosyltransferase
MTTSSVSVVVMAYNEEDGLAPVVEELRAVLEGMGTGHELLIVDDGSTDGTGAEADRLASRHAAVRVVHHGANLGLGGVYRTGFARARMELVTFWPADGQFPAAILEDMLPRMRDHELVLGHLPGHGRAPIARILSAGERVLYRALFGPMPRFQGVFVFRRDLLHGIELVSRGRGWAVCMELIIRISRGGHRIASVPTALRPRRSGASKVNNLRAIASNLRQVLALRARL